MHNVFRNIRCRHNVSNINPGSSLKPHMLANNTIRWQTLKNKEMKKQKKRLGKNKRLEKTQPGKHMEEQKKSRGEQKRPKKKETWNRPDLKKPWPENPRGNLDGNSGP